jgi:hypothetical protein
MLVMCIQAGSDYEAGHGQVSVRARTRAGCTRMSDSSDVEVFTLAAVCEEIEEKIKSKDK